MQVKLRVAAAIHRREEATPSPGLTVSSLVRRKRAEPQPSLAAASWQTAVRLITSGRPQLEPLPCWTLMMFKVCVFSDGGSGSSNGWSGQTVWKGMLVTLLGGNLGPVVKTVLMLVSGS